MTCFDVYLNGEKLCRAGKNGLGVLNAMVVSVQPKPDDDGTIPPICASVGGLYTRDTGESVHPHWITEQALKIGDEITFKIVESDTADAPAEETTTDPAFEEEQQRKYYQFLKAKYEGKNKDLRISGLEEERIPQLLDVATVWIDEAADLARRLEGERRGGVIKLLAVALESISSAKLLNNSPPYEGGVAAASADGVVLSPETPEPDGPMTPDQQASVAQLTPEDIQAIDEALLANCSHQFRKLARVVAMTMGTPIHKKGIPDLFYAERIRQLLSEGRLESQGDLNYMRFSEVRLADR